MWEQGAINDGAPNAKLARSGSAADVSAMKLPAAEVITEAPVIQRELQQPALAEEKVIHVQESRVQPVVVRDILKTEVHQIEQPVLESKTMPVEKHTTTLPEQNIEKNDLKPVAPLPVPQPSHIEEQSATVRKELPPIIQERVHHAVIEQIQPVVYREIIQPHETLVIQPIHERIVEPAVVTRVVAQPILQAAPVADAEAIKRSNHAIPIINPATGQAINQAN